MKPYTSFCGVDNTLGAAARMKKEFFGAKLKIIIKLKKNLYFTGLEEAWTGRKFHVLLKTEPEFLKFVIPYQKVINRL